MVLYKNVPCPSQSWTLRSQKSCFYLLQWKSLKNDEKCFLFHVETFFVLEIFTLLSWLLGLIEKRLNKKTTVDFNVYDVIGWTTINYNIYIYIAQYLKK